MMRTSEAGLTIVELVVSMAVTLLLSAAVLMLLNAVRAAALSQPEVSDLQQRLRVALQVMAGDVANAGAGLDRTPLAGPLSQAFPAIAPYRRGQVGDDAASGVFYRPDAVSVVYVAVAPAQALVTGAVHVGGLLVVQAAPNCGPVAPVSVCGFTVGMRAVLLHPSGAFDFVTVESVTGASLGLSHVGALASAYNDGRAALAHALMPTYALGVDATTGVPQLTRYDGFLAKHPAVDHIVGLSFEYFGVSDPPRLRPGSASAFQPWLQTSYGPPPPALGVDDPATTWGPGENCAFVVVGGMQVPRLATLAATDQIVPLVPSLLVDGPWCPDASAPHRFDADLLRIRRVRMRVRAEAAPAAMRGSAGALFARSGGPSPAMTLTPDHEAVLDATPRNLSAGR